MSIEEIENIEYKIIKPITFLSEFHIPENTWLIAEGLVKNVDDKDTPYIAFSLFYRCKIWSGDKVLRKGLAKKGFYQIISTDELFELRKTKNRK